MKGIRKMAQDRTNVTWSEDHQKYAEMVVAKYAGEMGKLGIPTRSATRPGGEESINRSGAILFALMFAAGALEEDEQSRGNK
jgi:hypothetical protein